ncbi:hypothetical protein EJB05_53696, partial [Eragrostis curvula]
MAASSEAARRRGKGGAAKLPHGRERDALVFASGAAAALLLFLLAAGHRAAFFTDDLPAAALPTTTTRDDDGRRTFYDDPAFSYAVTGRRVAEWDAKRAAWLRSRGLTGAAAPDRVLMVSGSQPEPCGGSGGDHLLLRFLKNKLDYCRLHGIELFYNRNFLEPSMPWAWSKLPVLRAAMVAHPEAEWLWWVDADAVLTDMDFSLLPLAATRYAGRNLVVHGNRERFFGRRSWLGINAGVFLIRNCQWSLDFLDEWARMGPAYPEQHAEWGKKLKNELAEKDSDFACDQSALAYLLLDGWERRGFRDTVHVETEYYLHGYWKDIVDRLPGVAARYDAVERGTRAAGLRLRRRHAEREHLRYAAARNAAVRKAVPGPDGGSDDGWRRPFVTHFVGCAPCSGWQNPAYAPESCGSGMRAALDFADDQVLRAYGFRHAAPGNDSVHPLPFDYPAAPGRRT